jgi:hypothetical protein
LLPLDIVVVIALVIMVESDARRATIDTTRACSATIGGVDIPYMLEKPAPTIAADTSLVVIKE